MIVSLSLIQYDTGLRLVRQQMDTHCNSLMCIRCVLVANECERIPALDVSQTESHLYCVLVALSLTILAGRMSLIVLYYNSDLMGEMRPESVVL